MTGKKGRCVVCIGKHNPCAECKRKKAAAAAPPASCQQCRRSPCDCPAASSKRPRTAASEATAAQPRCASCGAWANSCDDCQRQPPADPVPLTFCPACTATPCCKGGCCQLSQARSAHTKPRTPAPSGHADIGGVAAGSTRQVLFADEPGVRSQCAWYQPYIERKRSSWNTFTAGAYTNSSKAPVYLFIPKQIKSFVPGSPIIGVFSRGIIRVTPPPHPLMGENTSP